MSRHGVARVTEISERKRRFLAGIPSPRASRTKSTKAVIPCLSGRKYGSLSEQFPGTCRWKLQFLVEMASNLIQGPFELISVHKSLFISVSFPNLAELLSGLKHEKNGTLWYCPALEMAPNGTSLLLQVLLLFSPGCLHHRSHPTRGLSPDAKRPNHEDAPLRQPFRWLIFGFRFLSGAVG